MEKTKDYRKFNFLSLNRRLNRKHINALKTSITKNGYLSSNPILVNENYEILDGQHRFIALKEMDMEIPYEVVDKGYGTIIDLNTTQHNWKAEDYINFYCEKDHSQAYIRLKRLCNEMHTSPTNVLAMAYRRKAAGQDFIDIKRGNLKLTIDDELRAKSFYEAFNQIAKSLRIKATGRLCTALVEISCKPRFKWKQMIDKAEKFPTMAYNCRTVDEFIVMLRDLYNYKTKKEEQRI